PASPRTAVTSETGRPIARRRRYLAPRWSAAGRAGLLWLWRPTVTTRNSAATTLGVTPSSTATTAGGSSALPARTRGAPTPGMRWFVVTRGGEYCFAPGVRGLRWISELTT